MTPRFALTSSERQLELARRLLEEHPVFCSRMSPKTGTRLPGPGCSPGREAISTSDHFGPAAEGHLRALHPSGRGRSRAPWRQAARRWRSVPFNLFLGSGLISTSRRPAPSASKVGLATGRGRRHEFLDVADAQRRPTRWHRWRARTCRLAGLLPGHAGQRQTLELEQRIGNLAPGCDADFVLPRSGRHPLDGRAAWKAGNLAERLFALMMWVTTGRWPRAMWRVCRHVRCGALAGIVVLPAGRRRALPGRSRPSVESAG